MAEGPADRPSQQVAQELLDEFMREQAAQKAGEEKARPQKRSSAVSVVLLACLVVALIAWNIVAFVSKPEVFSGEDAVAAARARILLAVQSVEGYREAKGMIPATLEDFGFAPSDSVAYDVENGRYRVSTVVAGNAIVYRDGEPLTEYRASLARLRQSGAGR